MVEKSLIISFRRRCLYYKKKTKREKTEEGDNGVNGYTLRSLHLFLNTNIEHLVNTFT